MHQGRKPCIRIHTSWCGSLVGHDQFEVEPSVVEYLNKFVS